MSIDLIGTGQVIINDAVPPLAPAGSLLIQPTTGALQIAKVANVFSPAVAAGGGTADINYWRKVGATHYEAWYTYPRTGDNLGAGAVAANRLYAFPFICPKQITVDRIGLNVTTGVAGNFRLGIYNDDGIYPGSLLLDGGEVSSAAPAGARSAVINQVLQANSLYWFAYVGSAGPQIYCMAIGTCLHGVIMGSDPTLPATPRLGVYSAYVYAALPATYPTPPDVIMSAAPIIAIFVRLSA